jgi:hypothetical protein
MVFFWPTKKIAVFGGKQLFGKSLVIFLDVELSQSEKEEPHLLFHEESND